MADKTFKLILYEKNGHIAKIVFNNPERRNAMSSADAERALSAFAGFAG